MLVWGRGDERLPRLFDAALWQGWAGLGRGLGLDQRTGQEDRSEGDKGPPSSRSTSLRSRANPPIRHGH